MFKIEHAVKGTKVVKRRIISEMSIQIGMYLMQGRDQVAIDLEFKVLSFHGEVAYVLDSKGIPFKLHKDRISSHEFASRVRYIKLAHPKPDEGFKVEWDNGALKYNKTVDDNSLVYRQIEVNEKLMMENSQGQESDGIVVMSNDDYLVIDVEGVPVIFDQYNQNTADGSDDETYEILHTTKFEK